MIHTATTRETFTEAMKPLTHYQRAKVYYVAEQADCPLWVALDYLLAEEWLIGEALKSLRGDI